MTITIDTYVSFKASRREKGLPEPRIIFSIPTHADLIPLLRKPRAFIQCYYRNLKFRYGQLRPGTGIRLTAEVEIGPRGGESLHVRELEIIQPGQPALSRTTPKMIRRWEAQATKNTPQP